MTGTRIGRGNGIDSGPHALVAAIFERAWRDVREGNGDAAEAEEFLRCEGTREFLAGIGVDVGYYERMLEAPERDREAELDERIRWMSEVEGIGPVEIAEELLGSRGNYNRVSRVVGRTRAARAKTE